MKIVFDANILISALLGSRAIITLITSGHFSFYVPKHIIDETRKHRGTICEAAHQTPEEFDTNMEALLVFVNVLEYAEYGRQMTAAKQALEARDVTDADYVACALAVQAECIWTNDLDFSAQQLVPTKTTDQLIKDRK